MTQPIGPEDFRPFLEEITDCWCAVCREVAYAANDVLDFRGRRHLAAAQALLADLRDGLHHRMTLAERAEEARVAKAQRLADLRASGASPEVIAVVERGYSKAVL